MGRSRRWHLTVPLSLCPVLDLGDLGTEGGRKPLRLAGMMICSNTTYYPAIFMKIAMLQQVLFGHQAQEVCQNEARLAPHVGLGCGPWLPQTFRSSRGTPLLPVLSVTGGGVGKKTCTISLVRKTQRSVQVN